MKIYNKKGQIQNKICQNYHHHHPPAESKAASQHRYSLLSSDLEQGKNFVSGLVPDISQPGEQ